MISRCIYRLQYVKKISQHKPGASPRPQSPLPTLQAPAPAPISGATTIAFADQSCFAANLTGNDAPFFGPNTGPPAGSAYGVFAKTQINGGLANGTDPACLQSGLGLNDPCTSTFHLSYKGRTVFVKPAVNAYVAAGPSCAVSRCQGAVINMAADSNLTAAGTFYNRYDGAATYPVNFTISIEDAIPRVAATVEIPAGTNAEYPKGLSCTILYSVYPATLERLLPPGVSYSIKAAAGAGGQKASNGAGKAAAPAAALLAALTMLFV